jgi:hypothetical protein
MNCRAGTAYTLFGVGKSSGVGVLGCTPRVESVCVPVPAVCVNADNRST